MTSRVADGPTADWRRGLPVLRGPRVWLREPVAADAPNLRREICTPEVCEFLPPPPTTLAGVEHIIGVAADWRRAGRGFCFAIVQAETDQAIGLIQFLGSRRKSAVNVSRFARWEWGFAVGSGHWRQGFFTEAASMALAFAFETVRIRRVDGWVVAQNWRANPALAKLGGQATLKHNARSPDGRVGDFVRWTHRKTRGCNPRGDSG